MRKVCIFTSTRAEWGLLRGVAELVRGSDALQLQLLVSGTHLSDDYGRTIQEIEEDGFQSDECVNILKFDDSPEGVCNAMSLAMSGYGEAIGRLQPDLLVVLGDRYETFCAAAVAQIQRVVVAHIHGGESTEGAVDEAFRHSITKMSHLHFPCSEEYRRRIIQLGENPAMVFNVGALGLENIRKVSLMDRAELEYSLKFKLDRPFFMVTFHPVTLENATAASQITELLAALDQFPRHKIIFTNANADPSRHEINNRIEEYCKGHQARCLSVSSLGLRRYLSAMKLCDAVVGNSSSGILETPAFGVPTVNIGDRQKGRIRTISIVDCQPEEFSICEALREVLNPEFRDGIKGIKHPCYKEATACKIVEKIQGLDLDSILKKSFYNI